MSEILTIPVDSHVLSRLKERAIAEGVDVITLAERALCREASRPLLKDVLKPVHDAFAASGMSDDELADFLEVEKHAMRGLPYEHN